MIDDASGADDRVLSFVRLIINECAKMSFLTDIRETSIIKNIFRLVLLLLMDNLIKAEFIVLSFFLYKFYLCK